ncbi:mammalian cell entry protein [Mycolicibacterium moriokaense]|jgi:virulence factor Mce-like protein|uniref:Mce family protein n=2 Tax=Mycolicibacterium moriokaense TaxID=39691 RepID=A0AAD1HCF0_9MYCO|nr:MCE family protein [Mycolicibacterium moriokaense]ORB19881.1 mammalian cell entry protein [Mycolicibacterium moriokaense]BBX01881.1 putative Mce family protein [Mycolicibacterium moriokaense]
MPQNFESAAKPISDARLLLRGVALLLGTVLLAAVAIAKSEGAFSNRVEVIALLANVGDGLPNGSDVKFRGALVGTVEGVTPSIDGGDNVVDLSIDPHFARAIPATVTARVVPGNVFAVSSIQLVDNGSGPALQPGSRIHQDESLATVQFQTALSKLREVMAAAGRPGSTDTVGVLAAVAEATSGRGDEIERAGGGANRIVDELNRVIADDGTEATLAVVSDALQGLQGSAPDLLDAVHSAVVPMRTFAEKRQELATFLSAGHATFGEVGTAFENNTDRMIVITTQLSPVMGVMADGSNQFAPIVTRINDLTNRFFDHVWHEDKNMAVGKFMLVLTPNRMYTRKDCPRYGTLEGPSCRTAPLTADPPVLPQPLDPRNYQPPGGNVGPVGSPEERAQLSELLGPEPNAATQLLFGPVARGNTVQVVPDPSLPGAGPPPGLPLPAEAGR